MIFTLFRQKLKASKHGANLNIRLKFAYQNQKGLNIVFMENKSAGKTSRACPSTRKIPENNTCKMFNAMNM